ncbi:MAG: HAD family phosphatase [Microbacteriaceae bacterium]|nr:HAD family phosphatase [Microbacteriaceae bacterium]
MDGTLVDTEGYWMAAETELIEAHGGRWSPQDALAVVGMGLVEAAEIFKSHGVTLTTREIIDWMTDRVMQQVETSVPWRPGARELLAELREAGISTALVTMSEHRMAAKIVEAIGFAAFDLIIGGDDVSRAKPDPEPYLLAARTLGVDISQCIALEDSVPGLRSAVASGAVSIGIPLHAVLAPASSHTLWESLDGKTLADLLTLFVEQTADSPHAIHAPPAPSISEDASHV